MKCVLSMLLFFSLFGLFAYGQSGGGTLPFGTADVHEYDSVDLATLVPTINIPVVAKQGAIPFSLTLTAPQICNLEPLNGWGGNTGLDCYKNSVFAPNVPGPIGTLAGSLYETGVVCSGQTQRVDSYNNFVLYSSDGAVGHPFASTFIMSTCPSQSKSAYAADNSGYLLTLTTSSSGVCSGSITSSGGIVSPLSGSWCGNGTDSTWKETDTFGNTITSTPNYTDTLGANYNVLISSNVGVPPANSYAQWTDSNGNSQEIKVLFSSSSQTLYPAVYPCAVISQLPYGEGQEYPPSMVTFPDGTSMSLTMEPGNGSGTITGRIASYTLRTGGTVSFTYPSPCDSAAPFTAFSNYPYPFNGSLTRTTVDGTTTYTAVTTGSFPTFFTTTTVLDPGKNKRVYYFTMGGQYLLGLDVYQNTGTIASPVYSLSSSATICYNTNQTNCRTTAPVYPITQRDVYQFIGNTNKAMKHSTQVYDTYGNVTSFSNYDYITGQTLTTSTTYGSWNGTQCVPTGGGIVNMPCDILTTDGTHTLSEVRYTNHSNGAISAKLVWTGSQWLTTSYVTNANGTIQSVTAPNGQLTTFGYATTSAGGCNSLLPTSSLSMVSGWGIYSSQTWDCNGAVVLTTSDGNGSGTTTTYDAMFRPHTFTDPSGYVTTYNYSANSSSSSASFGSSIHNHISYVDSLGRPIIGQTQQGPTSSNYDTVSTSYAWSGANFQTQATVPCTQIADQPCTTVASTSLVNPAFGPISRTDANGGTTTYTRNQNDASVTIGPAPSGEHVKTVQTEVDGLGRTKSVCALETSGGTACGQVMGNSGILTSYAYSFAQGSSTTTVTRGSQTHSTTTDAMSRPTSSVTPERGTVTYYYDTDPVGCYQDPRNKSGYLTATKDNSGVYNCYGMDGIGRTVYILGANGNQTCRRFYYDGTGGYYSQGAPAGYTGQNLLGRLVEASTDNCIWNPTPAIITDEWFSYDKNGRMTDLWESTPNSGGYYHTFVTYNPDGAIASINGIPGYAAYAFGVDGEGRPNAVSQGTVSIVTGVTFDPASRPLNVPIGNLGDSDSFTYDSVAHMKTYTFSVNGNSIAGSLTWDPDGTLGTLAITDSFNAGGAQTCNFAYDDVARLTDDNCGSTLWHQTFGYDQYDNLTKTGNPGTSWNPGYNSANNQMIGSSYDSNGELLYDGVNTYTWDAFHKMVGARAGNSAPSCGSGGSFCPTYDAFGRIVEVSAGASYKQYLFSPVGRLAQMSGATTVTEGYIPLPGGLSMKTTATGGTNRIILHKDWLGTARFAHNLGGRGWVFDTAYSPYGETYDTFTNGTLKLDFTGDQQDIFAGLFDTPNREFAQNASRWLSPDPADASWNAYSYPTNPTTMIDPSGLGQQVPCPGICPSYNPWFGPPSPFDYIPDAAWNAGFGNDSSFNQDYRNSAYYGTWGLVFLGSQTGIKVSPTWPTDGGDSGDPVEVIRWSVSWLDPSPWFMEFAVLQRPSSNNTDNGSWWSALKHSPWVVSWILPLWPLPPAAGVGPAGSIAWNPATKTLCGSLGAGASVGDNLAAGPVTGRTLDGQRATPSQINQVFSGWSANFGFNVPTGPVPVGPGVQVSANGSGVVYGPTVGVAGASASATYAVCASF